MQEPKAKTKAALPPPPAGTEDLALIDAASSAAVGSVGVSWWLEEVRSKRAPQPAIRAPRFTRWLLKDVREFWEKRIAEGSGDAADAVVEKAKKASKAAQEKRIQAPRSGLRAAGPERPGRASKHNREITTEPKGGTAVTKQEAPQ